MQALTLLFAPQRERLAAPAAELAAFIAVLAIWALAMMLFAPVAIGTLAIAAAALLLGTAWLSYQRPQWRIFALLLVVEVLPSANFLPVTEASRPLLRYPLYLLFCLPMLPRIWRSGILSQGGFRLYSLYFGWALMTVAWSPVPAFSLGRAMSSALLFAALCSVALDLEDAGALQRILRWMLLACAILTSIICVTAVVPAFSSAWFLDPQLDAYRLQGLFDSPNQVGELNMITIGAALACWSSLRPASLRIGAAILVTVSALMMVAADSRSAAVAIALGTAVYTVWHYRWRGLFRVAAAGALAVFIAAQLSPRALLYFTRGDVVTLTGRTEVMHFALRRVMDNPLLGYGFGAEGEIFRNRYFPSWEELWTQGPRIPIHNGYISRAVGVGVPAALLWLFLFLRPLVALFRRHADTFQLREPVLLLVLPVLILYLSETLGGDCRYPAGIVITMLWAMAEKERLRAIDSELPATTRLAASRAISEAAS